MPSVDPPSVLYAHYCFRSGPRRFGTRPFNFMLGIPVEYNYSGLQKLYFRSMLFSLIYKNMTIYVLAGLILMVLLVGIPLINDPKADTIGVILFVFLVAYLICRCVYVIWNTLVHPNAFYKDITKVAIDDDGICFINEPGRFHKVGWKGVVKIRYWKDIVLIDFTALPTFIVYNKTEYKDMITSIVRYKKNA